MAPRRDMNAWFAEAGFGLFIHWGLYALLGRGEQVLFRERLDPGVYRRLATRFNPRRFDPADWARRAKAAGMRYAVLTAKHHDGFCLFDSAVSDYTAAKTGAGCDLVARYVQAFRRAGLGVGLYYSLADWSQPAYFLGPRRDAQAFARFVAYTHEQVRELCANYGRIDVLWFDGGWPHSAADWQSTKLNRLVRRLQPQVMINDRLHGGGTGNVKPVGPARHRLRGYYDTFEQRAAGSTVRGRPAETCRTTQDHWWGWHAGDRFWKTPRQAVKTLVEARLAGANLLLNVGPRSDGTFPAPFGRILAETERWWRVHQAALDGVRALDLEVATTGVAGGKPGRMYLFMFYWPGAALNIHGLANRVRRVRLLGQAGALRWRQSGLDVHVAGLPRRSPDPSCAVLELQVDGKPARHPSVIHLWEERRDVATLARWAAAAGTGTAEPTT